jgi:hypothetical protein
MAQKELIDRLVVEEYRDFAQEPLGYTADRDDCVERLVNDGATESGAEEAWEGFEKRYLVHDGGGLTLSAHGVDRAEALGETVYLDESVRTGIIDAVGSHETGVTLSSVADETGVEEKKLLHNLWILRRRGVVETRTDVSGDGRSVVLNEP